MVGVLVSDQDVPDRGGINVQPLHFFLQPGIVVARVDHDGEVVLGVKENICHPLAYTGHMLVDAPGVQGLEDRPPAEHSAHGLFLVIRIFSCHAQFSFFRNRK